MQSILIRSYHIFYTQHTFSKAIFADEIDSRKLMSPNAPKVVQKNISKPCPGAVTATLDQLGIGGRKEVIQSLKFVPDKVFKMMGKRIWASGKGYNI